MNPVPFQTVPPQWFPMLPPNPPTSSAFWESKNVHERLRELQDTLDLAKAMKKELEILMMIKDGKECVQDEDSGTNAIFIDRFKKILKDKRISLESQESLSVEAVNALMSKLRAQLEPFRVIVDEATPWEEKSAVVRLSNKIQKNKRNKLWRKRKRKRIAEMLTKEREQFEQADKEADEWRAREIAKDIAKRKVEKMKEVAKLKAKEERKKLESELEQVLIVEKLQELRSIRIQKLKKQGHFLPEEDDKFMDRVRAAVEEEERQAIAAADTDAARDAIASAEESRKTLLSQGLDSRDLSSDKDSNMESEDQIIETENNKGSTSVTMKESEPQALEGQGISGAYDSVANLPLEFYHYYHGSNTDMGTLIEVRRTWDAYIRPGGSRIPGHWVQPPPPADETWASYLVRSK
ncbi:U11/U12 small nuclear ribonucleoprotein 59 kDa protein [Quercus robur]|uniref:U11/U12 small nuclear ribonucleoprotein 59 kDa protein n=1 Tax=Quercus robur TaxID=38942 RepID=UPI002161ECFF|nr:U11/U12 small nuclear ribonucleoprotein 59 kDa protein [Quercus robur]XP_050243613.1 U11/U12 small nuclear ribonucleoprotein 59 kDa protein [Quercus robur]XP_050243614.1 U11/U12 small nuclear ribonucleoprotein 59 kDa protein [Quercus robur]XP_050243615.1 U11/U12 small nuclear ribonucleoprotein 59 kDa protein [Quercus robur]